MRKLIFAVARPFLRNRFLVLLALLAAGDVVVAQRQTLQTRAAVVAGQFYPQNPDELRQSIQSFLDKAPARSPVGKVMGLIVPHAGYVYSGATAALGYRCLLGEKYDVVIVLAPSHRDPFTGVAVFPGSAYQTPLGRISVEQKLAAQLVEKCSDLSFSNLGHQQEHSLEVQLPFLQVTLPQVPVIPMVVGAYDCRMVQRIAESLSAVLQSRKVLFIASTDLYHGNAYEECETINTRTLDAILAMKPKALCEGFLAENYQACGGGPVVIMQAALQRMGAKKTTLLGRTNSNDVTGQRGGYVVGYAALAITGEEQKMENPNKVEHKPLDTAAQKELLRMAREAIVYYLDHKSIPTFTPTLPVLKEKRGVFVTLTEKGELRGCIGYHEADRPLYELVPDRAIAAAFDDPRFMPLRKSELDQIHIKVSVYLTNVYRLASLDEFKMGEHGIIMMKNGRGATYLPEVPLEAGWKTVEEEMESLCQKAGLPHGAWKQGAEFYVYKTQVFGEKN